MAQELLVTGTVLAEDFAAFVSTCAAPSASHTLMLVENQPRCVIPPQERQNLLQFAVFDPAFDFTSYTSGRIFHAQGELRWQRRLAHMHIVFTGAQAYRPGLQDAEETALDNCEKVPKTYFLFGKRLDDQQRAKIGPAAQTGDFAEVRIPRLLRYPRLPALAHAGRVQLAVYEYVDKTTGANVAYRFYDLVPFQKSQE